VLHHDGLRQMTLIQNSYFLMLWSYRQSHPLTQAEVALHPRLRLDIVSQTPGGQRQPDRKKHILFA
jgi:hypothetical protein